MLKITKTLLILEQEQNKTIKGEHMHPSACLIIGWKIMLETKILL